MTTVKAAAVQLSPVLYSREGTVEKIMKQMAKVVPDAASYAPVTILVDERADGVHLSYDSMASLLAPYGSEVALGVARDLDAKIESLLVTAAA